MIKKRRRKKPEQNTQVGGAVTSRLERWTPDRGVLVRGLAGDIELCSWVRHFTLTVPLSTQVCTAVSRKVVQQSIKAYVTMAKGIRVNCQFESTLT